MESELAGKVYRKLVPAMLIVPVWGTTLVGVAREFSASGFAADSSTNVACGEIAASPFRLKVVASGTGETFTAFTMMSPAVCERELETNNGWVASGYGT